MGQIVIAYADDAGTKWALNADADQQSTLSDMLDQRSVSRVAPFGAQFANLAALNAVTGWEAVVMAPSGLSPRTISAGIGDSFGGNVSGAGLASLRMVVGDVASFNAVEPTGLTPFPESTQTLANMGVTITGASGESRSSN